MSPDGNWVPEFPGVRILPLEGFLVARISSAEPPGIPWFATDRMVQCLCRLAGVLHHARGCKISWPGMMWDLRLFLYWRREILPVRMRRRGGGVDKPGGNYRRCGFHCVKCQYFD